MDVLRNVFSNEKRRSLRIGILGSGDRNSISLKAADTRPTDELVEQQQQRQQRQQPDGGGGGGGGDGDGEGRRRVSNWMISIFRQSHGRNGNGVLPFFSEGGEGNSLEILMKIIQSPIGFSYFFAFTQSTNYTDHIDFFVAVEKLRNAEKRLSSLRTSSVTYFSMGSSNSRGNDENGMGNQKQPNTWRDLDSIYLSQGYQHNRNASPPPSSAATTVTPVPASVPVEDDEDEDKASLASRPRDVELFRCHALMMHIWFTFISEEQPLPAPSSSASSGARSMSPAWSSSSSSLVLPFPFSPASAAAEARPLTNSGSGSWPMTGLADADPEMEAAGPSSSSHSQEASSLGGVAGGASEAALPSSASSSSSQLQSMAFGSLEGVRASSRHSKRVSTPRKPLLTRFIVLPAAVMENTKRRLLHFEQYGADVFAEAVNEALKVLANNVFPKFVHSSLYSEMVGRSEVVFDPENEAALPSAQSLVVPPPKSAIREEVLRAMGDTSTPGSSATSSSSSSASSASASARAASSSDSLSSSPPLRGMAEELIARYHGKHFELNEILSDGLLYQQLFSRMDQAHSIDSLLCVRMIQVYCDLWEGHVGCADSILAGGAVRGAGSEGGAVETATTAAASSTSLLLQSSREGGGLRKSGKGESGRGALVLPRWASRKRQSPSVSTSSEVIKECAWTIFLYFVAPHSAFPMALAAKQREAVMRSLAMPHPFLFNDLKAVALHDLTARFNTLFRPTVAYEQMGKRALQMAAEEGRDEGGVGVGGEGRVGGGRSARSRKSLSQQRVFVT